MRDIRNIFSEAGIDESKFAGVYKDSMNRDKPCFNLPKDLSLLQPLVIDDIQIRQDAEGRYCLNDLHKASGGEEKHLPYLWGRTQATKDLIDEICQTAESLLAPAKIVRGGRNPGTYVCKELVYSYAMWISPSFNLKVIRVFDAYVTGKLQPAQPQFHIPQTYEEALRAIADESEGKKVNHHWIPLKAHSKQAISCTERMA